MQATFDHLEQLAPNIATFWFRPDRPVRFVAGQFTELHLPHQADERGERRWFTISSSPTEPLIGITTRLQTTDGSSYKQQLQALRPGARLHLAEPMGDFVLPKDPTIPLVFVAGGLGITPVRSMLAYLEGSGEQRPIAVVYAVTHTEDAVFVPTLSAMAREFTLIVKHPPAGYTGHSGSLSTERLQQLLGADDGRRLVYISGPEPMVETFTKELQLTGQAAERIVSDYFPGYARF